jgi:XTP/dITP diphosphohydrolase
MEIILSSRNPSKAEQIRAVFVGLPISILTLADAGIDGEAVEDGLTLEENALLKARFAFEKAGSKSWAMADDTGLFVEALNGEPGVKSARWAGDTATTEEILYLLLKRMEGKSNRSAVFETAVSLIGPDGEIHYFVGKVRGRLLEEPRVPPQPKMPYSSIFIPEGQELTWAEMTIEQENAVSHRGKAFGQVRDFLVARNLVIR